MKKFFFIFLFFIIIATTSFGQKSKCEKPEGPAGDAPDDNLSFSSGILGVQSMGRGKIHILSSGYTEMAKALCNRFGKSVFFVLPGGNLSPELLVVPSAGFMGQRNDTTLKITLEQYVNDGGTILVFAQQYGADYERLVPVPEGQSLKAFGWREDQSCRWGSMYFKDFHPSLAGQYKQMIDSGVDGYFSAYPSNSTILARRTQNQEPTLLYYPYGKGTVILTSMYTDYGLATGQASRYEVKLIRDLVSFARNPAMAIPSWDLNQDSTPLIALDPIFKNSSQNTAVRIKIKVLSPDRSRVFLEKEEAVSLAPGAEATLHLEFEYPELQANEYDSCLGIGHTDYELVDGESNLVQLGTESDSGRFSIAKVIAPYYAPSATFLRWLTVKEERVHTFQNIEFTAHFKNSTSIPKSVDIEEPLISLGHGYYLEEYKLDPIHLTVPANSQVDYNFVIPASFFWEEHSVTIRLQYTEKVGEYAEYRQIGGPKYIFIKKSYPTSIVWISNQSPIRLGDPISFSVNVRNDLDYEIGQTAIKISALDVRGNAETLFETSHDFSTNPVFNYSGTYIPSNPHVFEHNNIRLEMNNAFFLLKQVDRSYMIVASNMDISSPELIGLDHFDDNDWFVHGKTYQASFKIKNNGPFNINKGHYIFELRRRKATIWETVYVKKIEGIQILKDEERIFNEEFTFDANMMGGGSFMPWISYTDETREYSIIRCNEKKSYNYGITWDYSFDKTQYEVGDVARFDVNIGSANRELTYNMDVFYWDYGRWVTLLHESRPIVIEPEEQFHHREVFQIPVALTLGPLLYNFEVKDKAGILGNKGFGQEVKRLWPKITMKSEFAGLTAKAGDPAELNLTIKGISGFTRPLSAILRVDCEEGIVFHESRNIAIQPGQDNLFTFNVPVPPTVDAGKYFFKVNLDIDYCTPVSDRIGIDIPAPAMAFTEPPAELNAGETLPLEFVNPGGKDGSYAIQLLLRDANRKNIIDMKETRDIAAGERASLNLPFPADIMSGPCILYQKIHESMSNQDFELRSAINVKGLESTLLSLTNKESFFESEMISGKSEITSGGGSIENGALNARIIRYQLSKGVEETKPGNHLLFNALVDTQAFMSSGVLYSIVRVPNGVEKERDILCVYDTSTNTLRNMYDMESRVDSVFVDQEGMIWCCLQDNRILKIDGDAPWRYYSDADGLLSGIWYDIIEAPYQGNPGIWVASSRGVSVFNGSSWRGFSTADGLPMADVRALSRDDSGAVMAFTDKGIAKYDGAVFALLQTPFADVSNWNNYKVATTSEGSWMAVDNILYLYRGGAWTQRPISSIVGDFPHVGPWGISSGGNRLWIWGFYRDIDNANCQFLALKDGTNFTTYLGKTQPIVGELWNIPSSNDEFFPSGYGYFLYQNGQFIHKVLDVDSDRLAGEINDLVADSKGNVWATCGNAISKFDGTKWSNYCDTKEHLTFWYITKLAVGPDDAVYAFGNERDKRVVMIKDGVVELIDSPILSDLYIDRTHLAVDGAGRLWVGEDKLYYYDGTWHMFPEITYVNAMTGDGAGGVWVAPAPWDTGNVYHLYHIKQDLTVDDHSEANSGLRGQAISRLCLDGSGRLWIGYGNMYSKIMQKLDCFDGTQWIDCTGFEGYPEDDILDFIPGQDGKLLVVEGWDPWKLHVLDGNKFSVIHDNIKYKNSLVLTNGNLYCIGGEPYSPGDVTPIAPLNGGGGGQAPNNFIKVHFTSGLTEEAFWQREYPLNLASGGSTTIDLLTEQNLGLGSYVLKTSLYSSKEQLLAQSDYPFVVRENALGIVLSRADAGSPQIGLGKEITFNIRVDNFTTDDYPQLNYVLKKEAPDGQVEVLKTEVLVVNAGGSHVDSMTFKETGVGLWRLTAEIAVPSEGGGLEVYSSSSAVLEVVEPRVSFELITPEFAGDESFALKLRLANEGKIASQIHALVSGSPARIDEEVILQPGEERILEGTDTISADKVYTLAIDGDVSESLERTIRYGYSESLSFNVLPAYREGNVVIEYTVANSGGLPFSETLHAEIAPLGVTVPVYSVEKTHNLYPGANPVVDSFSFQLLPGVYELKYRTGRQPTLQTVTINVIPAGQGVLSFVPEPKYSLGRAEFPYTLSNVDSVQGTIPLTMEILDVGGNPVFTETRNLFLNPTESISGALDYDFQAIGNYTLRVTSSKIATSPLVFPVRILNPVEVNATVQILAPEASMIPVRVNIDDRGYADFLGKLVVEASGSIRQFTIEVSSETTYNQVLGFDVFDLSTGSHQVKATLLDNGGTVVAEASQQVTLKGSDIKVTETPQSVELSAGGWVKTFIKLKNDGNREGTALLRLSAFDNLNDEREIVLEPGEELLMDDVYIDADSDIPTGSYPLHYSLSGTGVAGGLQSDNFTFKVNGVKLDVNAAFDKSIYQEGETARLTIEVSSQQPVATPLEAVVNWGEFSERREFILDNGSSSQVFEIPLTTIAEGKVFYGIYHLEGRGIYLNDIYLNVAGAVSVILDQQVYAPGSSINAIFRVSESGVLTAEAFGTSQKINVGSETTLQFPVPSDTLGGTYGVAWSFIPLDVEHQASSGSKLFDVSGFLVKVARAELERGKYAPGETIQGLIAFESNRDETLELLTWTTTPLGISSFLGAEGISLAKDYQVPFLFNQPFQTSEAGTHYLSYALYQGEKMVVSGSLAFACGDAVLLGVSSDRSEYPNGNEEVKVRVDYFGEGTANLQLFVDDVKAAERSITLAGVGFTELILGNAEVGGGSHRLQAVMTKDNLTSTKNSSFTYGTNLPDLQVYLADQAVDGLNYTYKIRVVNHGKTAAPASLLMFSVDGASVSGVNVGALEPGAFQEFDFAWSGSGKAGEHKLVFAADDGNTVKEYSEANNEYTVNLSVPALFYKLEVQPDYLAANMTATIYTRLINNQPATATYLLHLILTHKASGQVVLERDKTVNLNGFAHAVETDLFETGINPAGDYTLVQTLTSGDTSLSEELLVIIETTQALTGTVELVPASIKANLDTAINVKINLTNAGNVALQDETLTIEVINKETQEQVKTESILVSLNLAEQKLFEKSLSLNLPAGTYLVQVKYLDKMVAEAELVAAEGLEKQKAISAKPRVLLLNLLSFPYLAPKTHLKTILQSAGVEYRDNDNILDSWVQSQKSEQTINVVFGNLLSPVLKAEIAERVFRGEGLILYCTGALSEDGLADVAGVSVKPLSFLQQEKDITVLPSVLGGGGAFTLPSKTKLWLEASAADVATIAETKNGQKPVMTYRPYGAGKVITIAVSLERASNQELARRLLLTAVALLNRPDVFATSDLSRVVPIQFNLKNSMGEQKTYVIKETIPQGVGSYGYDPQPDAGDELKFTLSIPSGSEKGVFYWAKMPDSIGTYDLMSEITENGNKLDEAMLRLEVTSTIVSRIDEIVAELNLVPAIGADKDKINLAIRLLENARNRTGDDIVSLYLDVVDCALAGKALREVAAVDVGSLRLKVANVLQVYARRFYDKAVTLPPLSLAPLSLRLQQ